MPTRIDTEALALAPSFVGLSWEVAADIGNWIWTHKTIIALRWLALALLFVAFWMAVMWLAGHKRDDDDE